MRSLAALLFCLGIVFGLESTSTWTMQVPPTECNTAPPSPNWVCVGGSWFPPEGGEPPPPPPTSRVISVGEEVTGTIQPCCVWGPAVFEMLFDLTAPSDGTLVVHLSNSVSLELEGADYWPWGKSPSALFDVATLQVTAGQTYRLWVYYGGWDLFEQLPFVFDNIHRVRTGDRSHPDANSLRRYRTGSALMEEAGCLPITRLRSATRRVRLRRHPHLRCHPSMVAVGLSIGTTCRDLGVRERRLGASRSPACARQPAEFASAATRT